MVLYIYCMDGLLPKVPSLMIGCVLHIYCDVVTYLESIPWWLVLYIYCNIFYPNRSPQIEKLVCFPDCWFYIFTIRMVSYLSRQYYLMVGSVYLLQGWSPTNGIYSDGWVYIFTVTMAFYKGSIRGWLVLYIYCYDGLLQREYSWMVGSVYLL